MPGESKSSKRRIEAKERQQRGIRLRMAGATYAQIADQLGYRSASGAYAAVKVALEGIPQPEAELYKRLNIERLNRLLLAIWERSTDMDSKPDRRDIAQCISIIAEMNKLSGAYAPVESKITLAMVHEVAKRIAEAEGTTEEMVMAEAEEIVKGMGF